MQPYHLAWLSKHPERSEQWLCERMADGFHVHHLDGNHANDDPANLVLMEGRDHMALHGMTVSGVRVQRSAKPSPWIPSKADRADCYWAVAMADSSVPQYVWLGAYSYSKACGLPWPPHTYTGHGRVPRL